jgi:hypothetical protein
VHCVRKEPAVNEPERSPNAAAFVPAWRASGIDSTKALREE